MNAWAKTIAFGFAFLLGVTMGLSAYHFHILDRATANAKTGWLVCGVRQQALDERADQFHTKFGQWPTNVQELVEARFLPEFSEVHLCPSEAGSLHRSDYQGSAWVDENQKGLVASHICSPYRFQVESGKFLVACGFDARHTR